MTSSRSFIETVKAAVPATIPMAHHLLHLANQRKTYSCQCSFLLAAQSCFRANTVCSFLHRELVFSHIIKCDWHLLPDSPIHYRMINHISVPFSCANPISLDFFNFHVKSCCRFFTLSPPLFWRCLSASALHHYHLLLGD